MRPVGDQTTTTKGCMHVEKDWRSTGTWQWKCKTCGHVKKGQRPLINQTGAGGGTSSITTSTPLSSGTVPHAQRIVELFSVSVELQKDLGGELSVNTLDKIYEKVQQLCMILEVIDRKEVPQLLLPLTSRCERRLQMAPSRDTPS